ncbi:MAG TPA: M48 family metalloprotease [Solirubrobacteraceae bacterium]|jgi:Zn-dependent protease with chaperone function|nr:M48 family metalloprotease [Solirubrobacteraceae bacterium]
MQEKTSLSAYLIDVRELAPAWLLLYAVSVVIQAFLAPLRAAVAYGLLWLTFTILGWSTSWVHVLAWIAGYGPLILSLATLALPLGGWLWQQQSGGRTPSERERLIYEDALAVLSQADPKLRPPRRWFVLDTPTVNAAAYFDTLMLTRGLIESGSLEAVLAHELGHLNSSDARLTAALHRLTTPPRSRLPFPLRTLGFLLSGAVGAWLMRLPWASYWRSREFEADRYAAGLGQGEALARFLEQHALEHDLPIPFLWLSEHAHPATEHRIDRLAQLEAPE